MLSEQVLQNRIYVTGGVILYQNKIAEESKKAIIESFFDLLYIKPISTISVTEIAENAEIDRRTFYRHFKSKEDIISYYIHEASMQYEEMMKINLLFDNRSIANAFFNICYKHKEVLKMLYKQNLLHLLLHDFNSIFQKYQCKFASKAELHSENRSFKLAYHIGGFWNLLIMWLSDDCKKTPDQMSEMVHELLEFKQI